MKKSLMFIFAASLMFVSCKRGLDADQAGNVSPLLLDVSQSGYVDQAVASPIDGVPAFERNLSMGMDITWGGDLLPTSRATNTSFQSGDDIGVYIHSAKPMAAGNIHSPNMRYVTSDKGATWRAANALSGSLSEATYFATAYYPYRATVADITKVAHEVLADQSAAQSDAAGNLEKSDFMSINDAAVTDLSTKPKTALAFTHRMSKFQISVSIPSLIEGIAVTKLESVTIKGLKNKGTIDLTNGKVTASTLDADIVSITPRLLVGDGLVGKISTYEAVVFPQKVAEKTLLVEFVCTVIGDIKKTLSYTIPAGSSLEFVSGKRMVLTLSSSADVAFLSELDFLDGKAKTDQILKIKAPLAAAWTLTSPVAWLKFSLTPGGAYKAAVSGVGLGAEQTVYASIEANNTEAINNWLPREATLTLAATTVPASSPAKYLVVQGYYRFEMTEDMNAVTLISDSPMKLPQVTSNQVWKLKGALPVWLKITKGAVKWAATNAANTIDVSGAGYDVVGSITDLYAVADPTTLSKVNGTLLTGTTAATTTLNFGAESIDVNWTHSYKNSNVAARPLIWAAGNLVSTNTAAANTAGQGGARIGSMYDGGLYFRFGSLVGLKGGALGSGVGTAVATHDTGYWLRPTGHTVSTAWANSAYFSDASKTSGDFKDYHPTDNAANDGIGDACRYYLGAPWRLPTGQEYGDLCNKQYAIATNVGWDPTGGKETSPTSTPATTLYGGWWSGTAVTTPAFASAIYFVGSGYRNWSDGALSSVGTGGVYWSSSIGTATNGLHLGFHAAWVGPQGSNSRLNGFTLRCVQ